MLVVLETVAITYVMRYAAKVQANPQASIVASQYEENRKRFAINWDDQAGMELTKVSVKLALVIFALTFVLMIYSVIPFSDLGITFLPTLGWYLLSFPHYFW